MENAEHFVLIHGACHGAWCWYKLVPLLKSAGHRVTALDLGACGINPKLLHELASISDYVQPLMEFLASLPEDEKVVLVGHSYGGIPISLAMEKFPQKILAAVFVTAYMPNHTSTPALLNQEYFKRTGVESFLDSQFTFDNGLENLATSALFGPEYIAKTLYKNCQLEDVELAKVLVRPTGLFIEDLAAEGLLTEGKFGSVKRVFVVCEEDEVMEEEFQRSMIENYPPKEVKVIRGAAHMVMLSKPKDFFLCLEEIAQKYH